VKSLFSAVCFPSRCRLTLPLSDGSITAETNFKRWVFGDCNINSPGYHPPEGFGLSEPLRLTMYNQPFLQGRLFYWPKIGCGGIFSLFYTVKKFKKRAQYYCPHERNKK
jgi:hypothetical protein